MQKFSYFLSILILPFLLGSIHGNEARSKIFTGKILGNKVRIRTAADLNSHVVQQVNKNELVLVVGEKNGYYAIRPLDGTKLYVYKTYIDENIVQADRVNVRLKPNLEAQILGQLKANEKVDGSIYSQDKKWLEITPTNNICFYVSKDYVQKVGDKSYYTYMLDRKNEVIKLINSAFFLTQAECKKPYNEMNPQKAISQFEAVIKGYNEFPDFVQQAKEGLALLQDNYLQKKIVYLETKANMLPEEKEELFKEVATLRSQDKKNKSYNSLNNSSLKNHIFQLGNISNKMKHWVPIENELYSTWATFHPEKSIEDFYNEQKANSFVIKGKLENFDKDIKNKPGDYILKGENMPLAYLYSIHVDLEKFVGKEVSISISPRPNNNFAFPAYFVNSIE